MPNPGGRGPTSTSKIVARIKAEQPGFRAKLAEAKAARANQSVQASSKTSTAKLAPGRGTPERMAQAAHRRTILGKPEASVLRLMGKQGTTRRGGDVINARLAKLDDAALVRLQEHVRTEPNPVRRSGLGRWIGGAVAGEQRLRASRAATASPQPSLRTQATAQRTSLKASILAKVQAKNAKNAAKLDTHASRASDLAAANKGVQRMREGKAARDAIKSQVNLMSKEVAPIKTAQKAEIARKSALRTKSVEQAKARAVKAFNARKRRS